MRKLRLQTFDLRHIDAAVDVAFDLTNFKGIIALRERDRNPFATRTAGTANTMHIVFRLHRQAVIEYVRNRRYVNPTRRHVGRNQHTHTSFA